MNSMEQNSLFSQTYRAIESCDMNNENCDFDLKLVKIHPHQIVRVVDRIRTGFDVSNGVYSLAITLTDLRIVNLKLCFDHAQILLNRHDSGYADLPVSIEVELHHEDYLSQRTFL
jgi:hypothetical protein